MIPVYANGYQHYRDVQRHEWTAWHYDQAIAEAYKILALAQQNRAVMDAPAAAERVRDLTEARARLFGL